MRMIVALALIALSFPACLAQTGSDEDHDPQVENLDGKEPLPKFSQVSPGIFRSAQPNREGLALLAGMGVKTVLSLRLWRARGEEDEVRRLGMRSISVPMEGIRYPEFDEVDAALSVLADPANRPILLHCAHGRDRTGTVVAAWRVAYENADLSAAAAEAESFGCCPWEWRGSLPDWLRRYRAHRARRALLEALRHVRRLFPLSPEGK